MKHWAAYHELVERVVRREIAPSASIVRVEREPLAGGITADEVSSVAAHFDAPDRAPGVLRFVVKSLAGPAGREADVYAGLVRPLGFPFAPRLLALTRSADVILLAIEHVAGRQWPWREVDASSAVLRTAAELHMLPISSVALPRWDYEGQLELMAEATLERYAAARHALPDVSDVATVRALRRLVGALRRMRRQLIDASPFPPAILHGDLHPGNVVITERGDGASPVFLDWGRARIGSPLEDVASWLQTLACWVAEARVRHDTILAAYLRARGVGPFATQEVREAFWLAGASNAVAGSLLHHISAAMSPRVARGARMRSRRAVGHWSRIIRHAARTWGEAERRGGRGRRTQRAHERASPNRRSSTTRFEDGTRSIVQR